jgi:hypothetical protein
LEFGVEGATEGVGGDGMTRELDGAEDVDLDTTAEEGFAGGRTVGTAFGVAGTLDAIATDGGGGMFCVVPGTPGSAPGTCVETVGLAD